jgi:hypothetical protein
MVEVMTFQSIQSNDVSKKKRVEVMTPHRTNALAYFCLSVSDEARKVWWPWRQEEVKCPSSSDAQQPCVCEASSDGLDFKCSTSAGRRSTNFGDVASVLGAARFLVKTLSITGLDANVTSLPAKTFANGSVAEFVVDGSSLRDVDDHAFEGATARCQFYKTFYNCNLQMLEAK